MHNTTERVTLEQLRRPDRRGKFRISYREEDRGPRTYHGFSKLSDVQRYIQARWQGVEYLDAGDSFHTDYCQFTCYGFTLLDLGRRKSYDSSTDDFWNWTWFELDDGGLDALTEADFEKRPDGTIRAGFKWLAHTDGSHVVHECYQFATLADVQAEAHRLKAEPLIRALRVVTFADAYKRMRTLYTWGDWPKAGAR